MSENCPSRAEVRERLAVFGQQKESIEAWLTSVRNHISEMQGAPRSRVHYTRWRLKEPTHIEEKIRRKWKSYRSIPPSELFHRGGITDSAGVRILVLYPDDLFVVDEQIWDQHAWQIAECVAWYDQTRAHDKTWFEEHGFREDAPAGRRQLNATDRGYASIHYLLTPRRDASPEQVCELQLRTIHQDAWAEFDHELKYPSGHVDRLASQLIARLSALLNVAEDMVRDIRRNPASALIVQRLWERAMLDHGVDLASARRELTEEFLPNAPYLYRAAPLAAVDLLGSSRPDGPAARVVSLDFANPADWNVGAVATDPLRRLYIDAHKDWVNAAAGRRIRKYFLSPAATPANGSKLATALRNQRVEVCCIPLNLFRLIHESLDSLDPAFELGRVQFFLWDTDRPKPPVATLHYLPRSIIGFYSPARTTDLTSGSVWLVNAFDRRYKLLRHYVALLDDLVNHGYVTLLSHRNGYVAPPTTPDPATIDTLIRTHFAPVMN